MKHLSVLLHHASVLACSPRVRCAIGLNWNAASALSCKSFNSTIASQVQFHSTAFQLLGGDDPFMRAVENLDLPRISALVFAGTTNEMNGDSGLLRRLWEGLIAATTVLRILAEDSSVTRTGLDAALAVYAEVLRLSPHESQRKALLTLEEWETDWEPALEEFRAAFHATGDGRLP
ncbi:hypothetical protein ERJ75_000058600 [Trypanosoma vivax]|nr:hypothetical protein TRVL_04344 [Trypanosoma vivax]KAH8620714.1 hypothetical protein ERJ75_000058600 [Trypanosoma vivax]